MQYGISTACLYPMETEQALSLLLDYGFRRFEVFINAAYELQPTFLSELKAKAKDAGATFCAMHPYSCAMESAYFFGDYPRRLTEGIDFYKKYFEAAAFLGADLFVLHGQKSNRDGSFSFSDEFYCERFSLLAEAAEEFGVTLCQENVFCFRSQSLAFIQSMIRLLGDRANFVFDLKQTITAKQDSLKMVEVMGKRIRHVHLSDNNRLSSCLLPGKGDYPLGSLLSLLQKIGFTGNVITEVYRNSFGQPEEILASRAYSEKLFAAFE